VAAGTVSSPPPQAVIKLAVNKAVNSGASFARCAMKSMEVREKVFTVKSLEGACKLHASGCPRLTSRAAAKRLKGGEILFAGAQFAF